MDAKRVEEADEIVGEVDLIFFSDPRQPPRYVVSASRVPSLTKSAIISLIAFSSHSFIRASTLFPDAPVKMLP